MKGETLPLFEPTNHGRTFSNNAYYYYFFFFTLVPTVKAVDLSVESRNNNVQFDISASNVEYYYISTARKTPF